MLLKYIKNTTRYFLAKWKSRKTNSKILSGCKINSNTKLEGNNIINKNVNIVNSQIGYATYIGENSKLNNSKIGRYCSIAEEVKIISGTHPTRKFVSTHPCFFSTRKQAGFTFVKENIFPEKKAVEGSNGLSCVIGNDVWLGANVIILEGIKVGDGVVVAAGAVVVKDLEPYYIYGGVPARKIGERFKEKERQLLMDVKWWNYDPSWLEENAILFHDIEKFLKYTKNR